MHPLLKFALMAMAVVSTAIVVYLVAGFAVSRRRQKCPTCGAKKFRCVQFIRATVLIDGARAPDSWSYFECESCRAHQKLHRGVFSVVADEEWQQYCEKA